MESNVALNAAVTSPAAAPKSSTYATYTWNFGDGSPTVSGFAPGAPPCSEVPWLSPCAASVFHSYKYGGTYEVTLTVRDVGGNEASVSHPITRSKARRRRLLNRAASAPPAPAAARAPRQARAPPQARLARHSTPASTTAANAPGPAPCRRCRRAELAVEGTESGLVVSYSVNEQVAGHFEVLLAASIAHRTRPARCRSRRVLPAGTPPQMVIAKAILITTKGGRSTIKIQFGKVTAARLRRCTRCR